MLPCISLIIPCYNEEQHIGELLDCIVGQDYVHDRMEVLIVDGMSNDRTIEFAGNYASKFPVIKILTNKDRFAPFAMNLGISASKGDYIFILGAHCYYPPDYCRKLVEWHSKINADVIGGIGITEVKTPNRLTNSIKKVLSNRLGVGNSMFRIGTPDVQDVDTVAYGCYRATVFNRVGLFNEKLIRNQDIELNKRILKHGGRIVIVPDVTFIYYARETLGGLFQNNFGNGKWVVLTIFYSGDVSSISIRHLVPLFFLLSLILPLCAALFWHPFVLVTAASLFFYLLIMLFVSHRLNTKEVSLWNLFRTFLTIHFSYGLGSLSGFFQVPVRRRPGNA